MKKVFFFLSYIVTIAISFLVAYVIFPKINQPATIIEKEETKLIKVPYSKNTLDEYTKISKYMIGYIEMSPEDAKRLKIITNSDEIINKYVKKEKTIYATNFFTKENLSDTISIVLTPPKGYKTYQLLVDSYQKEELIKNKYIDIYFSGKNNEIPENEQKLIENIKIEDNYCINNKCYIVLFVTDEMENILNKALNLDNLEMQIKILSDYANNLQEPLFASNYLYHYILSKYPQEKQ